MQISALRMLNRATPRPEVNELLDALTNGLRNILGDQLVAAYLFRGAWIGRQDPDSAPRAGDLSETWAFIRYAIGRGKR